jgi:L-2-hydroxycarboxylate dehydrogenase (NAD+)
VSSTSFTKRADAAVHVSADEERELIASVLRQYGAPSVVAEIQAEWLMQADLRGHPSHGIARLPMLVRRVIEGLIVPDADPTLTWRSDSLVHVDGERGFGPVVASAALDAALARVTSAGVVLVAIANSNHVGMLAPYVERIAREGLVGIGTTTSEALVHPWGGRRAMIGTNPLAIAVPASPAPLVLDMATGETSMGRILHYREEGIALEPGWALDADGEPTTDASAAAQGSIAPFGGAKGFALGLALEVLIASLTGSALGRDVRGTLDAEHPSNKGDLFIVIDPVLAAGRSMVDEVSRYLQDLRESPSQDSSVAVRVPGERGLSERERRTREGVDLAGASWKAALSLLEAPPTSTFFAPNGEKGRSLA